MTRAYTPKPCRRCGGQKDMSLPRSMRGWYCEPCRKETLLEHWRKNSDCGACASRWDCPECIAVRRKRQLEAAARGVETRRKNQSGYFKPFNAERYWQQRSHAAVQAAIKRGLLPSLKGGEYACVDCGGIALEYDHRDYASPLDVQPVCRSCNKQRGTAKWPTAERYQFRRYAGPAPAQKGEAADAA